MFLLWYDEKNGSKVGNMNGDGCKDFCDDGRIRSVSRLHTPSLCPTQADADLPPPTTPDMVLVPLFHAEFDDMSFVRVGCSNEM